MTSSNYIVEVSIQARRDTKEAVFYKKELGTREDNLDKFKEDLAKEIQRLKTSPKVGANLSSRMDIETSLKYLPVQDYLLFYEILEDKKQVDVIRLLPAKTNWMSKIMKSID
ncbi:TPA: type II toxin-antitoxin system RelE/ParE family toxin [Streptococcus agalactiae]